MKEPKSTTQKEEGFIGVLFNLIRSVKLTIGLLILLAIVSIIGTLIKQNASSAEYIERYGVELYHVLNFFNLFDMYHSWWFSAILILLVVNLIACSIRRIQGIVRQVFRGSETKALEDAAIRTLPYVERIRSASPSQREEEIQTGLKKWLGSPRRIETESSIMLFSEKGRFSRLGFPVTHLSILIILIGGLLGSVYGFRGFVNILEGETVDQVFLRIKDKEVARPLGFKVRCDDFTITYYDLPTKERHVKSYASTLTVLQNGKEVLTRTIEVNRPLHHKGLAFYQSSYGAIRDVSLGVQRKDEKEKTILKMLEGETVPIPNSNAQIRLLRYVEQVHTFGEGVQVVLFKPNQAPQAAWVLKNSPRLDQQRDKDFILTLEGVHSRGYTGLQVTKDPGVWIVWIGSGLMMLGLLLSFFFSHQRVWAKLPKGSEGEIILAGSTNKNRVAFEKAFGQWVEEVRTKSSEFKVRS
ncbi:MAG: cytochrome c biogenesis protein ResB [Thermodesulfobacteriota bacterium]